MIVDLATRGEISWAYGKLYVVDPDQYWVQGVIKAVSHYLDTTTGVKAKESAVTILQRRGCM